MKKDKKLITRGSFIVKSGAALSGMTILPSIILGGKNHPSPSDKLNIAGIGAHSMGKNYLNGAHVIVSLRVSVHLWMSDERRAELLGLLRQHRDTIEEVCFFTSFTHSVLPYATLKQRAELLKVIIPQFRRIGLRTGINHLCTFGHLDENLENSLNEPWQKMTDINGVTARGSYCPLDPRFQAFTRQCYQALAEAEPDFIWIDDDVRMGHHPPVGSSCFCDLCLARFSEETGQTWTRERAARVIYGKEPEFSREVRAQWAAHNCHIFNEVFTLIRNTVDTVNPNLVLGYMPTNQLYETMDYPGWGRILAGERHYRLNGGQAGDSTPMNAPSMPSGRLITWALQPLLSRSAIPTSSKSTRTSRTRSSGRARPFLSPRLPWRWVLAVLV